MPPSLPEPRETLPLETELPPLDTRLQEILGYLNFSKGKPEAWFQKRLDELHAELTPGESGPPPLNGLLLARLDDLQASHPAFSDCRQARGAIAAVFDHVIPAYRRHHADLLFHVRPIEFYRGFFVARVFEQVLATGGPWDDPAALTIDVLDRLNDFLGHRPVAVLENGRRMQPYSHERFRPVPLYLRGAGVGHGPYQRILSAALQVLEKTPADVLESAYFHIERLDEIGLDLRAYDHSHPVYKRTNYTFGEWDPHLIDGKGHYRRFILRQVILDALTAWLDNRGNTPLEDAMFEAAAVLAGTILMASSVSGDGPTAHDSNVSLTSLLPRIARQRDSFYDRLLKALTGEQAQRRQREAREVRQPFGRIRQFLNLHLAHYGCRQLQRSHLAYLYARLGNREAARRQASVIPSTAVRFETEIQWRITSAAARLDANDTAAADVLLQECEDFLKRGVECGALVDPWNILGFQGQFPLFSAREDSIPDHRAEKLLNLVEQLFHLYSRTVCEASVDRNTELVKSVLQRFRDSAEAWDRYATTVVSDLPNVKGQEAYESAAQVASILEGWFASGRAAGDIAFWKSHVTTMNSPAAFSIVVDVLLRRGDLVAAFNLLLQWLSQSDAVPLEAGPSSFYSLVIRWMGAAVVPPESQKQGEAPDAQAAHAAQIEPARTLPPAQLLNFLERLDANSGEYGRVPTVAMGSDGELVLQGGEPGASGSGIDLADLFDPPEDDALETSADTDSDPEKSRDDREEGDDLFGAAYEGWAWRDSTQDGHQGDTLDGAFPAANDSELDTLGEVLEMRLRFLVTRCQLWRIAAEALARNASPTEPLSDQARDAIARWVQSCDDIIRGLGEVVEQLREYEPFEPSGDPDSLSEYDRDLHAKFTLVNSVISAQASCLEAARGLRSCLPVEREPDSGRSLDRLTADALRLMRRGDPEGLRRLLPRLLKTLVKRPLLYIPIDQGGGPREILTARNLQFVIRTLLGTLPRLGLIRETWHVLNTAFQMERTSPPSGMSITEFDRLMQIGLRSSVQAVIRSSRHWGGRKLSVHQFIALLQRFLEPYADLWSKHSRTMRLSSAEVLKSPQMWRKVKGFIKKYGGELFEPRMLTLGQLRANLHRSTEEFLEHLYESNNGIEPSRLLEDIGRSITRDDAVYQLEIIFRCIVEKFDRFMEYNTTTTQSDYGEQLFCLLDFLRLEADYERAAWNLMPQILVHEVLAREGMDDAAERWRHDLDMTHSAEAKSFLQKLRRLERQYSVRLPSIADRINERLSKPLELDRILALVKTAARQAPGINAETRSDAASAPAFTELESRVEEYLSTTSGSPTDLQPWLQALGDEVQTVEQDRMYGVDVLSALNPTERFVTLEELSAAIQMWEQPLSRSS
jgi:hypothetical protein